MASVLIENAMAADGDLIWEKRYDSGYEDRARDVATDSHNNIVVVGSVSYDNHLDACGYIIKYNQNGKVIWEKRFTDTDPGRAQGVAIDAQNNIIVTGNNFSGNLDYYTIKYDPKGNVIWEKRYVCIYHGTALDVATDSNNNIVVVGGVSNNYGYDWHIIKYDPNGNIIWNHAGLNDGIAQRVVIDSQNNIIVLGNDSNNGTSKWYIIKYDPSGNVIWEKFYTDINHSELTNIAIDSQNNIIVTGLIMGGGIITKYDLNGKAIWEKLYRSGQSTLTFGVTTDSQDNIIAVGLVHNYHILDWYNWYAIKFDSSGNVIWEKLYEREYSMGGEIVTTDSQNNIIVAGFAGGYPNNDYYTVKLEGFPIRFPINKNKSYPMAQILNILKSSKTKNK